MIYNVSGLTESIQTLIISWIHFWRGFQIFSLAESLKTTILGLNGI